MHARREAAFDEDQMGVSGFRPAPHINPDELECRLRAEQAAHVAESSRLPPPGLSRSAPNVPGRARTSSGSTRLFDVGPSPPSYETHDNRTETTTVDAEEPQAVDVDDLRVWWEQGLAQEATES